MLGETEQCRNVVVPTSRKYSTCVCVRKVTKVNEFVRRILMLYKLLLLDVKPALVGGDTQTYINVYKTL